MKTIITTVGTSLFTNYREYRPNDIDGKIRDLEPLPFVELNQWKDEIKVIKETIDEWINEDSSAEIKSLLVIQNKLKDTLEVCLLITDTILSNIAAEIIQKYFENSNNIRINKDIIRIKDLQVGNYNKFIKGRDNLVREIRRIIKREFDKDGNAKKAFENIADNYIFSISGGYKIIIPTITIISQIYNMRSYYIFENSDDLIENALIPLGFDDFFLEKLYFSIDMLKHQENYLEKDSGIKNKLKSANFIIAGKVTELGELFYDYVHYHREISRSVLGYFVEYKLYEYFIEQKKFTDIKHSYTEHGREKKVELDFVLDDKIIVEVKPIAAFLKDEGVAKIQSQIDRQLSQYSKYKEHHLYLYTSFKEISSKHKYIKNNLEESYISLRKTHPKIEFKVFEVYWSLRKKNDNQYQTFMKQPLTDKDITEIKIKEVL